VSAHFRLALRDYRRKRGWSQDALGVLVGKPQPTISRYEHGLLRPSDAMLARLAAVLGVSLAYVLLQPVVLHDEERGAA
jgi:transcriptional regulator with XRE-family HTH domain